jgi:hypothetical protein
MRPDIFFAAAPASTLPLMPALPDTSSAIALLFLLFWIPF